MKSAHGKAPFLLALSLAVMLVFAGSSHAASIAALVNGDAISNYDVQQRARLMEVTRQAGGAKVALDDLIEEKLKLQEARKLKIGIPQSEVDSAFASIAQRIKLQPAQLVQALGQAGVNADTLKNRLRSDLAWRKVVQAKLRGNVQVREQDVIAALQTRGKTADQTVIEYDLHQIVFVTPDGSSQAAAVQKAAGLRGRFASCEQTLPQLTGMRDVVVRRIGKKRSIDLDQDLREKLATTQVNSLTSPNPTRTGVEVIAVCGRQEVRDDRAGRQEIRQELMSGEMEAGAAKLMKEMRQAALIERR